MYYSFAPYEQDFRAWWESKAFPEVNPLTHDFLNHLTRPGAPRRPWRHQEEALMRTVCVYELFHVYDRYKLFPGATFSGPAIIEERESTVIVGEDAKVRVDEFCSLWIEM